MLVLNKIFIDNEHYTDKLGFIGDAFVETMFWLYSFEAYPEDRYNYCLDGMVQMPDFMTCVYYLINISQSKQPRASINDFVNDFRTDAHGNRFTTIENQNRIITKGDSLILSCMNSNVVEATLWGALVFWSIHAKYGKNESLVENAQKARKALYEALRDCTCLIEDAFAEHFLVKSIEPTLKRFSRIMAERKKLEQSAATTDNMKSSTGNDAEVAELQTQIIDLKKELELAYEELSIYKEGLEELTLHQKVIFEFLCQLLEKNGANIGKNCKRGNKAEAARLLESLTGIDKDRCANYLSNRDLNTTAHSAEVLQLNTIIKNLGIKWQL